jgi:hypothetical protein
MDSRRALDVVSSLAAGTDPDTGETFAADSPYQSVTVVRALYVAVQALQVAARVRTDRRHRGERANQPWLEAEDQQLLDRFKQGLSVIELAKQHQRSPAAIQARLERHCVIPPLLPTLRGRGGNKELITNSGHD